MKNEEDNREEIKEIINTEDVEEHCDEIPLKDEDGIEIYTPMYKDEFD